MRSAHVFLICLVVALSMEQALAWGRRPIRNPVRVCVHLPSWLGRRRDVSGPAFSVQSELTHGVSGVNEQDIEFAEWLQNNATLPDILGLLDTNCDGFVDADEWHNQRWKTPGPARQFTEALNLYDTNGDDMLTADEVAMAPMEMEEMDEFMVMPMEMFNDMTARLGEGNNNPRPQGPKGRKNPDDDE
ncbi:uncharacterized protein [Amphiura filiformis]|uniref:uncharacterized protein n=1 Tax=Amphiura filiformis TaxID=82378 RepID=UPI003B22233B